MPPEAASGDLHCFLYTVRMPSYVVHAINIGSFLLGEADKVITIFTAEHGLLKAVAKGARKPNTKMSGRSDVLSINKLFLAHGKTFEIISQAECIETFPEFRADLTRMSYALYYAELSQIFGSAFSEETQSYYDYLLGALQLQARSKADPAWLCLEFEMGLIDRLGYRPELTYCVICRDVLGDYNVSLFNRDSGGIICQKCAVQDRQMAAREGSPDSEFTPRSAVREGAHITPLVWKNLVLAADRRVSENPDSDISMMKLPLQQSVDAARRLVQGYIEYRAGRRLKSLNLLEQMKSR